MSRPPEAFVRKPMRKLPASASALKEVASVVGLCARNEEFLPPIDSGNQQDLPILGSGVSTLAQDR